MRYTVNDSRGGPPGRAAALMPVPARDPVASSNGLVHVVGAPGTLPIPSPRPAALPPISASRLTQPSACSPDMITPSLYATTPANMHPPMRLLRTNDMPVPARSIYALPGIAQRSRRTGGQSQVVQPYAVQVWPAWRGPGSR